MNIISDNYIVRANLNLSKDKKFLSFSDIHYGVLQQLFYKGTMKKYFDYLVKTNKGVDAILIPGDLIFYLFKYQDAKFLDALRSDLTDLSFRLGVPIFISYGNHDLPFNSNKLTDSEKQFWDLGQYIDSRKDGVFVLDNEQIKLDSSTVITGFSPVRDAYNPSSMSDIALSISSFSFSKANFSFNESDLNILMSHENKFFTHSKVIKYYRDLYRKLTCIIGGHLHDGYVPVWFQKIYRDNLKDYGIWETIPPIIDKCRGAFIVSGDGISDMILPEINGKSYISLSDEEAVSIVNRGVSKYSWFLPSALSYSTITFTNQDINKGFSKTLK